MAKTDKRTDTVKTGTFTKEIRIPIDPDDIEKKELASAKLQLKIRRIQATIRPELQKITLHRSEHRKLLEDIELGSEVQKAKVYEVKNFKKGVATIHLAENDRKVDERTLEKADYQTDAEDSPADEADSEA